MFKKIKAWYKSPSKNSIKICSIVNNIIIKMLFDKKFKTHISILNKSYFNNMLYELRLKEINSNIKQKKIKRIREGIT